MAELPYLPFWTDAYWADCSHLTDAEHGIYLQLLIHTWRAPGCRLPNDDSWLARKMARSAETIECEVRPVLSEFFETDGNWLWQPRLSREWERATKRSRTQSEIAKARWDKEKNISQRNANTTDSGNASTSTSTSTSRKKERSDANASPRKKIGTRLDLGEMPETWATFAASEGHPNPAAEFDRFHDYWVARSGEGGVKLDWPATWRNWIRKGKDDGTWAGDKSGRFCGPNGNGKAPGHASRGGSVVAAVRELLDESNLS